MAVTWLGKGVLIGLSHTPEKYTYFQSGSGAQHWFQTATDEHYPVVTANSARKWDSSPSVCDNLISTGKGSKVRVLAIVASVSGLLLATGAFLFWAANGLPYQDATAALLRGQHERAVQLELVMLLGIAITNCGQLLFVAQSAPRRKVIWPLSSGVESLLYRRA
jgi:hypothetical protein